MIRTLLCAASALTLTACASVGPNYASPAPQAPAQAPFAGAAAPAFSQAAPPAGWWRLYQDPVLDRLVSEALAANTDLRVAEANLRKAQAALRETRSAQTPSTTLGGSAARGRSSAAAAGAPQAFDDGETYDVGIDLNYQLDLFGGIRRAVEASRADVDAVAAARDTVAITVAAETTRAYADACAAGDQLQVANRSVTLLEESLTLTRRLLDGGQGGGLDVARSAALLEQTRATVPTLQAARTTALYRLSVLTGRPPADISQDAAACTILPRVTQPLPVGDGAALLARRPDVRRAERTLAASTARIGVATAELYPSISLGLSAGSTVLSAGDLGKDRSFRYSLGPLLSWNFPNITAARSRIAQARAGADADLASFDGTWLTALQETESALTRYARELDRNASLQAALDHSNDAARLARARYRGGIDSYLTLLDAERTLVDAQQAKAQSDALISNNQINLFLALGGGWDTRST